MTDVPQPYGPLQTTLDAVGRSVQSIPKMRPDSIGRSTRVTNVGGRLRHQCSIADLSLMQINLHDFITRSTAGTFAG